MSENVFPNYRTGTFTTQEAGAPTYRWVRDHHVIHLFLPDAAAAPADVVAALPASIRPSQVASLTAQLADGPRAVHYLAIPGQLEDADGVMQRVPEGEMLDASEDETGQAVQGEGGDAGVSDGGTPFE